MQKTFSTFAGISVQPARKNVRNMVIWIIVKNVRKFAANALNFVTQELRPKTVVFYSRCPVLHEKNLLHFFFDYCYCFV